MKVQTTTKRERERVKRLRFLFLSCFVSFFFFNPSMCGSGSIGATVVVVSLHTHLRHSVCSHV